MSDDNGRVTVRLHGALRHEAGTRDVDLPGDIGTVGAALQRLGDRYGERASHMIFDRNGNVWRSLILLVNEEPAKLGPETRLKDGDTVSILLPLAGG